MKVIQLTEERFNEIFEVALTKLRLEKYTNEDCKCGAVSWGQKPIDAMHRSFHYEVSVLKKALEEG